MLFWLFQGLSIEEAIEILQGQSESSPPAQQQASPAEPVRQDSLEAELSELISSTVDTPDVRTTSQYLKIFPLSTPK